MALPDEPRAFLYGRGGSGKSTIAQEVFRQLKSNGGSYKLGKNNLIDQVIFLSAKRKYLNVEKQEIEQFAGNDFTSEIELYKAILILGGTAGDDIETASIETLKAGVQEFFKETACLLVIDDIPWTSRRLSRLTSDTLSQSAQN